MDNDFSIDLEDLVTTLETSEVVVLRFVAVGQRLLFDFRATDVDGPLVKVVMPVSSVEARQRELVKLRPRLASPERIVAAWWPRFASSIRETGIWDVVMRRVADAGHPDAARRAEEALDELVALEAEQQRRAVTGDGFRTMWSASAAAR